MSSRSNLEREIRRLLEVLGSRTTGTDGALHHFLESWVVENVVHHHPEVDEVAFDLLSIVLYSASNDTRLSIAIPVDEFKDLLRRKDAFTRIVSQSIQDRVLTWPEGKYNFVRLRRLGVSVPERRSLPDEGSAGSER